MRGGQGAIGAGKLDILRRRARRQGIEALNCAELLTEIGYAWHGSAST